METPSRAVSAAPALRRVALGALALALGVYLLACASVYASQDGHISADPRYPALRAGSP